MGRFITAGGGGGGGTVTPPLAFGIGLTQTGLIVDLDPAREAPGEIGGFNEAPADGLLYARVNNAGVAEWMPVTPGGLPFMGANPPPPVPPATQVIAGTLWWRVTNGSLYVYFFDGLNYQWVTASPTGEVVGAPLIFPPAPVVGAVLAATNNVTYIFDGLAWNAEDIGGGPVHIGPLPPVLVAPAVTHEPGTLWWRNDPDGVLFVWYDDGTSSQWVPATPASQSVTNPAGNDPSQIGIVWVPQRSATQGLELLDGYLTAPLATEFMPGVINEPEVGDVEHVRVRDIATGLGKWVTASTGGGIGDVPPDPPIVWGRATGRWMELPDQSAKPAGNDASLIGTVWVPPRSATQGLELLDGYLTAPLATPDMPGVINEPEVGDVEHVRVRDIATGLGKWVSATTGGGIGDVPADPVAVWGRTIGRWVEIPTFQHVEMKVDKFGDTMTGFLTLHDNPIEPFHAATRSWVELEIQLFVKEPPNDDVAYARKWHEWVPVAGSEAGRGLTMTGNSISLDVATTIDLGGVFVPALQGLELTQVGGLTLARATPEVIGGLLDAPRDDTGLKAYARKWGQWVETSFVDAPDDGKLYGRQWEGLGTPGDPFSMRWMEAVAPIDLELVANNKVSRSGDTMQGALFLPMSEIDPNDPGGLTLDYPNKPQHAVHKAYCDSNAGGFVHTDINPPTTPKDGQMWWQSDNAGLYIYYTDANSSQWVQVNGMAGLSDADVIHDAPVDDILYGRLNHDWHQVNVPGDFKYGFQTADHDGWIKLDGRPLANLNTKQSANASALGFATNIPDATGKVPMQNGLPLGDSSGTMSRTLSQANLPNISLTAGSTGAHTHTASSAGAHTHTTDSQPPFSMGTGPSRGRAGVGGSGYYYTDAEGAYHQSIAHTHVVVSAGAHTHATDSQGAHTHVVPLGGTALPLDITPASLAVTAFIFLGR